MGSRTRYPLPESEARRLRRALWLFVAASVLVFLGLILNLSVGDFGQWYWKLWGQLLGVVIFPAQGVWAFRRLRRHVAGLSRAGGHGA
jgi:uncharacterized membrane protein